jgi:hypothetical protein
LISGKPRGSLAKKTRLNRYVLIRAVGSGSNSSDPIQFGRSDLHGGGPDGPIWLGSRGRRVCTAAHAGDGVPTSGAAYGP